MKSRRINGPSTEVKKLTTLIKRLGIDKKLLLILSWMMILVLGNIIMIPTLIFYLVKVDSIKKYGEVNLTLQLHIMLLL
jgi:hypothetical protein